MSIANSVALVDAHPQPGGSRYVVERHADSTGRVHQRGPYLAPEGFDTAARLAASAVQIAASLAEAEAERETDADAFGLQHQTAAEFAARFWSALQAAFQNDDKLRYHRMVWWIWSRIQAGDFTSAEVRTSFNSAYGRGLNASQWNSLVTTRFIPIKDRYLAMLAEGDL